MAKSILKFKNYEVHAIGSANEGTLNLNIASWVMQTSMNGKTVVVALYKPDLTIELVKKSNRLCISFLAENQTNLISKLGRKSGRETDKLSKLDYGISPGGCPFLNQAIGYLDCEVLNWADGGDHQLAICKVNKTVILHPEKPPLRLNYLREKGLIRG
jgi:flavin reductase (DIM6/NTAB) family NADH-FMN oxidoreductase RutF